MNLFGHHLFLRRNPGRELAAIGHAKHRASVKAKARQLRDELGLEPSPALRDG